jgi:hypothetical protein
MTHEHGHFQLRSLLTDAAEDGRFALVSGLLRVATSQNRGLSKVTL